MHITRLSVRRSRPSTRRSDHTYAQPSTTATSKTEMTSSESIRGRAPATVEYGNRLVRIWKRRAQGYCPPPDARTRAEALNTPATFPPNALVTGSVIGTGTRPVVLSAAFPANDLGRVRTKETGMERLISTPSRHPRSALRISEHYMASDPRPDRDPS